MHHHSRIIQIPILWRKGPYEYIYLEIDNVVEFLSPKNQTKNPGFDKKKICFEVGISYSWSGAKRIPDRNIWIASQQLFSLNSWRRKQFGTIKVLLSPLMSDVCLNKHASDRCYI